MLGLNCLREGRPGPVLLSAIRYDGVVASAPMTYFMVDGLGSTSPVLEANARVPVVFFRLFAEVLDTHRLAVCFEV